MRIKAFGEERSDCLLASATVAQISLDVLVSGQTGHIVDVRKTDPLAAALMQVGLNVE
jgi:hypothetical protein